MRNEVRPEILAPCGSMESVRAAISCGADAVYLGQRSFNARQNAANFGLEELCETVRLCHLYGVKVYQTLNTLVFDSEFGALKQCIADGCTAGVDAFIVQDMGVLRLASAVAPEMRLHASTQMTIHTAEGARFLEELGVKRAVLARELSLEEIAEIRRSTALELEVFVHGALCVCVSGQCYMSGMLGGRSGNRGCCAQPCRLPFSVRGDGTADLSLKDLSAVELLPKLAAAGVGSFKIEGRMKRPEYVAAAVTACVKGLSGERPDMDSLRAVFSRSGFTDGYLTGMRTGEMFGNRRKEDVTAAAEVLKPLHNLYRSLPQKIGCTMRLTLAAGNASVLTVADADGNTVTVQGEVPQQAETKPLDYDTAQGYLAKLGGTPYYLAQLETEIDAGLTLPARALNALRRDAIEQLNAVRVKTASVLYQDKPLSWPKTVPHKRQGLRIRVEQIEQLDELELERIEQVIFPLRELDRALPLDREKAVIELPRVMFGREKEVYTALVKAKEAGFRRILVQNPAQVRMGHALDFTMSGGFGLNVLNSAALAFYREQGLQDMTLSFEGSLEELRKIRRSMPVGILGYGHLPLMITRSCPFQKYRSCDSCSKGGSLTDRQGKQFEVRCHDGVREIYNPDLLYLADRKQELSFLDFITLYFTGESAEKVKRITDSYLSQGEKPQKLTRGLYYRKI